MLGARPGGGPGARGGRHSPRPCGGDGPGSCGGAWGRRGLRAAGPLWARRGCEPLCPHRAGGAEQPSPGQQSWAALTGHRSPHRAGGAEQPSPAIVARTGHRSPWQRPLQERVLPDRGNSSARLDSLENQNAALQRSRTRVLSPKGFIPSGIAAPGSGVSSV